METWETSAAIRLAATNQVLAAKTVNYYSEKGIKSMANQGNREQKRQAGKKGAEERWGKSSDQ